MLKDNIGKLKYIIMENDEKSIKLMNVRFFMHLILSTKVSKYKHMNTVRQILVSN